MTERRTAYWTEEPEEAEDDGFVGSASSSVPRNQAGILRVGDAWIGGNFEGGARGPLAFDIQGERDDLADIASGDYSIALGSNNKASGLEAIAVGRSCIASEELAAAIGYNAYARNAEAVALGVDVIADGGAALAVGFGAQVTGANGIALGHDATATASRSIALGYKAAARVAYTLNVGGLPIVKRSEAIAIEISQWPSYYAGAELYLLGPALDLKTVAEYQANLPTGCRFFMSECGVISTAIVGLISQPTIRFGIIGSESKQVAPSTTTRLVAVGKRERLYPALPEDGDASFSFGVTAGATATTLTGRPYWRGLLVENEA